MIRPLPLLSVLAAALLAVASAPAASPPPTLAVNHIGPSEVPGPHLVAITVQHTTWIKVFCAGDPEPIRSLRNPFPARPTRWEFVTAVPLCAEGYVFTLDAIGEGDPPPATFGPFTVGDGDGAGGSPLANGEETVYLPLLEARP